MAPELPLERLQRWMQEVVVHPGEIDEALTQTSPLARVEDVILPSSTLTPGERVEIYQRMYPLRMQEALSADYPGVQHWLGDDGFAALVHAYTQAHPSRSYTLNRLGDRLPEFIRNAPASLKLRRRDVLLDIARLELAMTQVFDEEETPALDDAAVAAVAPEDWGRARLTPIQAFRLVDLRYPVTAWLDTLKDEHHHHPAVRRQDLWVAVFRRDYMVFRLTLTRPAHDLLASLLAGMTVGDAVEKSLSGRRPPKEEDLFKWFRDWLANRVFARVELA
jgi:hypothetical protein